MVNGINVESEIKFLEHELQRIGLKILALWLDSFYTDIDSGEYLFDILYTDENYKTMYHWWKNPLDSHVFGIDEPRTYPADNPTWISSIVTIYRERLED